MLCQPELYFRPKTEEQLVEYLHKVALHAPNTPILYYHYPLMTEVHCKLTFLLLNPVNYFLFHFLK